MNYFVLLGLNHQFNIDLKALESAYFAAQRQYHPDRFIGKPAIERAQALQHSADINQAYERMIKSDVKYRFVIDMSSLS